jgi:integrase
MLIKTHKEKTILWITKWTLSTEIRKFSKEVNIKFTAHAFMHTFITWLAKQWASIYKIAKLAGHTNINTTNTYLHSADAELSETVNMLTYR